MAEMTEPRFVVMHDDHLWDNRQGFYVGIAMDEDNTSTLAATLNASQSPSTTLSQMRADKLIWGCE